MKIEMQEEAFVEKLYLTCKNKLDECSTIVQDNAKAECPVKTGILSRKKQKEIKKL